MATRKLVDLDVTETSGVDRGAHLHDGFLVMKNANDTNRVKARLLEVLGKSKEDNLSSVKEQIELAVAKAVGDYEEKVVDLEAALEAAKNQAADLASKLDEIQSMQTAEKEMDAEKGEEVMVEAEADPMADPEMEDVPDEVAKSLMALPAEQRSLMAKAFKAQADEVAKATEEIRKERDIRLDGEAIAKSKETFKSVGIDHAVVAPALRRLSTIDPALAKTVESVLLAVDAQATESGLLKEFGSATGETPSVMDEAKALAKSLVDSGVVKTIEQGVERVLDTNPALAKRYAQEGNK